MTATDIKSAVREGTWWIITNHYIDRESHPCYGTRRRYITESNSSAFYTCEPNPVFADGSGGGFDPPILRNLKGSRVEWPRRSQMEMDPDGTIRLYGGGINQGPRDLFLTLVPADEGVSA